MEDIVVGQHVSVKGYRSNSNGRLRAGGTVIAIRDAGGRKVYDVEAGVDGRGLIVLMGCTRSDLVL